MNEPFELRCIKREIETARKKSIPLGLTKITIHTTDAIWMVEQVEKLQKIADAWNHIKAKGKQQLHRDHAIDIKI